MKGYIYISGDGADPALKKNLNDPLFRGTPTLGACMPNIRRLVEKGDWVFVVSGRTPTVQQYVVGGLKVSEKISALSAYDRFPENRLRIDEGGKKQGNIIVLPDGSQHPDDTHQSDTFESRIQNYLVGSEAVSVTDEGAVERARSETIDKLASVLDEPPKNRVIDVMGRWRKLDASQIDDLVDWLKRLSVDSP